MWARSSPGQPEGTRPVFGYQARRAWKDIYYLRTWECWILIHKDKGILVRTNSSRLFDAHAILTKKWQLFFSTFKIKDVPWRCDAFVCRSDQSQLTLRQKIALCLVSCYRYKYEDEMWSKKSILRKNYVRLRQKHCREALVTIRMSSKFQPQSFHHLCQQSKS